MIYGGVQKNIGPAGVVIAIIREDLITEDVLEGTPTMLTYKTHADAKSLYNTPPAYGIYICGKVFKWLKAQGGLAAIKEKNEKKAKVLYDFLDQSKMFKGTVVKKDLILDHNGNVLIEKNSAGRSVIKESTAWLLTSAMEDVVTQGTGTACQLDNMPVAGKTGTTEAYNDLWFVGYTPYYTCAVWSGYDNNEKLPDYARNFHKALWKKVMTRIHEGLPSKEFEKPASVEKLSVCEETGWAFRSRKTLSSPQAPPMD